VLCEPRAAFLRADDLGVLRGDGVFERFIVRAGRPRHLEDHLARLVCSGEQLDLGLPEPGAWKAAVELAVRAWTGPDEWEMRLVCTRGPEEGGPPSAYALGQELPPRVLSQRRDGVAIVTLTRDMPSPVATEAPWLLLGAKTLSYAVNMAALRWARSHGADDAVFVSTDGRVWEGPTSSVVAASGRSLVSPPPSLGILASISIAHLFEDARSAGWEVARRDVTIEDLSAADCVWLSSSLRLARVHTLDGKELATAAVHAEIAALAAAS
ncbi:MAG TPA: aminodeoxychorismate lyase, partial [Acidimicrobiales bacterium]|nr:aminodeoxychorismate lyase [Acidimicrobiales bacterium]